MKLVEKFYDAEAVRKAVNEADDLHSVRLVEIPKGATLHGIEPKDGGLIARYSVPDETDLVAANE